ncbi:MAG: hypothetical protein KDB23_17355 [Planctomycetales bacterium]|nr:hypothetical protein [Planctomycetales bacterium]
MAKYLRIAKAALARSTSLERNDHSEIAGTHGSEPLIVFADEFYEQRGDYWDCISAEDRAELRSGRSRSQCPWCKRWNGHFTNCAIHAWKPTIPFGRFRGQSVESVPSQYLRWLVKNREFGITDELRDAALIRLAADGFVSVAIMSSGVSEDLGAPHTARRPAAEKPSLSA